MKIALASDAWHPQVNGVVTALSTIVGELRQLGHEMLTINPEQFPTLPCPGEPDIRLALACPDTVRGMLADFRPEAIHIATEGPVGAAVRRYCVSQSLPFTSSYHTQFPFYLKMRLGIPTPLTFRYLAYFHRAAETVMVTTQTLRDQLEKYGIRNTRLWPRGVDTDLFRPRRNLARDKQRPTMLYVGRVAVEKNLETFLQLPLLGTKRVVGDGPALRRLSRRYPRVDFAGRHTGEALARYYAAADVFVFPSLTDTYGLVLLEALASGVPIAAYPVQGPRDVLGGAPEVACLHPDLGEAIKGALRLSRRKARAFALRHSWTESAQRFVDLLTPLHRRSFTAP